MNHLQLFQETARKAGMAIPTTTVSQTGENARILKYVDEAWLEIQGLHNNWNFMWARGSFPTTASTKDYDPGSTTVNYINPDSMTLYDSSEADEGRLVYVPYQRYRRYYDVGTHTAQKPVRFTVLPNRYVRFHPTPDDAYTVQFDYYKKPTSLSGDTDEPGIPVTDLHWIIVWGAWRRYGEYEESGEIIKLATAEWQQMLARLRREEMPLVDVGLPHWGDAQRTGGYRWINI